MRYRFLAAFAACSTLAIAVPMIADAKARLLVVYQGQSDPGVADAEVDVVKRLAQRLDNVPGYDAKAVNPPAIGSAGQNAARLGADHYLVVTAVRDESGGESATITEYASHGDQIMNETHLALTGWQFAATFDPASVLAGSSASTSPSGSVATSDASTDGRLVTVPGGMQIIVRPMSHVSSSSAQPDETFGFQAADDVFVDGNLVIRKGAPGQGTVVAADGAHGNGHAGKLLLEFNYITSADGSRIALAQTQRSEDGVEKKGAASTATIVGYAFLGLPGLFMERPSQPHTS